MKITSLAMKCNRKQWLAIQPTIREAMETNNEIHYDIDTRWRQNPYLFTDAMGIPGRIMNCPKPGDGSKRVVHHEWNEEVFLVAIGVK